MYDYFEFDSEWWQLNLLAGRQVKQCPYEW